MLSRKNRMMSRAKDDFFRKPRKGVEHRQDVKPRVERSEADARARVRSEDFAETPEAGDGAIQEVDQAQVFKDRATEFVVGAAVGGIAAFILAKVLALVLGDPWSASSLAWYGVVFGGGINAAFLRKAPR
jgi:hypothetical protein